MKITVDNGYIEYSEDELEDNAICIDMVEVNKKRQGTGKELVNKVIDIAIAEGKDITLCAYPQDDSIELFDLVSFYESCGFEIEYDDGSEVLMRRSA